MKTILELAKNNPL